MQSRMENLEIQATLGTQGEDKHTKKTQNTTRISNINAMCSRRHVAPVSYKTPSRYSLTTSLKGQRKIYVNNVQIICMTIPTHDQKLKYYLVYVFKNPISIGYWGNSYMDFILKVTLYFGKLKILKFIISSSPYLFHVVHFSKKVRKSFTWY